MTMLFPSWKALISIVYLMCMGLTFIPLPTTWWGQYFCHSHLQLAWWKPWAAPTGLLWEWTNEWLTTFRKRNYGQMFTGAEDWSQRSFGPPSWVARSWSWCITMEKWPPWSSFGPYCLSQSWEARFPSVYWGLGGCTVPPMYLCNSGPTPQSVSFLLLLYLSLHGKTCTLFLVGQEGSVISFAKVHYVHIMICPRKHRGKSFRCQTFISFQEWDLKIHCKI